MKDILYELLLTENEIIVNHNKQLTEYIELYDKICLRYKDKIDLLNYELFILRLKKCKMIK